MDAWIPLDWLDFGAVRPTGWLADRMSRDLAGFVGHLDLLVPDLIRDDDIYGEHRLTSGVKSKDVGAISDIDQENAAQFLWWNSETQSNWRDGWVRHNMLVGDEDQRAAVRAYVQRMVSLADDDGYMGIYSPDLRFPEHGENGELWAQATLGRALLGYVEATDDREHAAEVLSALERAARTTMANWPLDASQPFAPGGYAGVAHGLAVTDVFDRLTDLTGNPDYRNYAAWLYRAFSEAEVSEPDAQLGRLLDPDMRFVGHGVHTWEHLRSLVVAAQVDDDPLLRQAIAEYLRRMRTCLTPAGGPIGDEWIAGRQGDSTTTGYEFCSIQELADSLLRLVAASGDTSRADDVEAMVFNAGFGAWHPELPAISYLQTDNAFSLTGQRDGADHDPHQTRYRHSPVHRQAAVCCVPNAGRLLPTLLRGALMRRGDDVVLISYVPLRSKITVKGIDVEIELVTEYPYGRDVAIRVSASAPVDFVLSLRRPGWASAIIVDGQAAGSGPEVALQRTWHRDVAHVHLAAEPTVRFDSRSEAYVTHGPLVLALPIPDQTSITAEYEVPGFADYSVVPTSQEHHHLSLATDLPDLVQEVPGGLDVPFRDGSGEVTMRRLVPMGKTVLRRVTFPAMPPQS